MSTSTIEYVSCNQLNCGSLPADVILCVPAEIVAPHLCSDSSSETTEFSYIDASLVQTFTGSKGCNQFWQYNISFDNTQLVEGAVLNPVDITGVICRNCLTQYLDQKAGNEVSVITTGDGSQSLQSQHGCLYQLAASGVPNVSWTPTFSTDSGRAFNLQTPSSFIASYYSLGKLRLVTLAFSGTLGNTSTDPESIIMSLPVSLVPKTLTGGLFFVTPATGSYGGGPKYLNVEIDPTQILVLKGDGSVYTVNEQVKLFGALAWCSVA